MSALDIKTIAVVWGMVLITYFMLHILKILKEKNNLLEYKINLDAVIDESIPTILNNLISEAFQDYMMLNLSYQNELNITAEIENNILKGVGEAVAARLSTNLQIKLGMYYNSEGLWDIISAKICMLVTNYVVEKNAIKQTKEEL